MTNSLRGTSSPFSSKNGLPFFIETISAIESPYLYIALINFNQETIPLELLLSFTVQRQDVPIPASFENIPLCIPIIILPRIPPLIDLNSKALLKIIIKPK